VQQVELNLTDPKMYSLLPTNAEEFFKVFSKDSKTCFSGVQIEFERGALVVTLVSDTSRFDALDVKYAFNIASGKASNKSNFTIRFFNKMVFSDQHALNTFLSLVSN
jgi:hypothetical protein